MALMHILKKKYMSIKIVHKEYDKLAHFDYFTSAHREPAAVLPCQLELCSLFFGSFKQVYLSEAVTWG